MTKINSFITSSSLVVPTDPRSQPHNNPPTHKKDYYIPASRQARGPEYHPPINICRDLFPGDMNQGEVTLVGTDLHFPVYVPRGETDYLHVSMFARECGIHLVEIGQYRNQRPILIRREDLLRIMRTNRNPAIGLRFDFPQGIQIR